MERAYIDLQEHESKILLQRDQLQELNEKIKKSNAAKLQFYTNISHELRTPLTLIMAPIEQLTKLKGLTSGIQQKHSLIYKNAHRLNELINQLLQFRKVETGNLKLKAKKGDIVQFIVNLSDQFVEYEIENFKMLKNLTDVDGIVFSFNSVHPKWSFVKTNSRGFVKEVAEKNPISNMASF